jgi:hypothetical protein
MHIVLQSYLRSGIVVGVMLILAACSTPSPKNRVNLFADSDYKMTVPGDVVAGMTTRTNGIWLSRPAIERLQAERILP